MCPFMEDLAITRPDAVLVLGPDYSFVCLCRCCASIHLSYNIYRCRLVDCSECNPMVVQDLLTC